MAKRRMLSQDLISDESFNSMSEAAQNLFIRMLLISDDCGITPGSSFTLKTLTGTSLVGLQEIIDQGLIIPFKHDEKDFFAFKRESFEFRQSYLIKNRTKSEYLKVDIGKYSEIYGKLQEFTGNYIKVADNIIRDKREEIKDKREKIRDSFGKCENLFFGDVPDDLLNLAPQLMPTEKADEWHDYVQSEIESLGYTTKREVFVDLGEEGTGRIDLVAEKNGIEIAIELDYRTPRKKSLKKLKTYSSWMLLLRDPKIIKKKQEFVPPSEEDVVQFFLDKGYQESVARQAFEYYHTANWKDSRGKPVLNWKQKMIAVWMKEENKISDAGNGMLSKAGQQSMKNAEIAFRDLRQEEQK